MKNLILTQDNRATSHPMFIVQRRQRTYGVDTDYTDSSVWMNGDREEASEVESAGLDSFSSRGVDINGWENVGFVEHWEFVTACFTEKGCEDYLAANGHDLGETRIYVDSGYRNEEWKAVRGLLSAKGSGN